MNDPFATAFAHTPLPASNPDFDRRVAARVLAAHPRRQRQIRRVLRGYWIMTSGLGVTAAVTVDASAIGVVTGVVTFATVVIGAGLAAGGMRSFARALRTTVSA